jgi:hypothetical protein
MWLKSLQPRTETDKLLVAGAVLSLLLALVFAGNTFVFLHQAESTAATIIDIVETSSDGSPSWYPVFRFTDKQGAEHEIKTTLGTGNTMYEVGQQIDILYKPVDPESARINSFLWIWGSSLLCAQLSVAILLYYLLSRFAVPPLKEWLSDRYSGVRFWSAMLLSGISALGAISSIIMAILFPDGTIVYLPFSGVCLLLAVLMWYLSLKFSNQARREPRDKD